ncbi:MAG: hypothetical protein HOD43_14630 [Candidatus Marinimicrobia bacterium]|nr:hypothetical protein [Candidatus Neomarinimicrobiota bacterium]MBT3631958.1 hypothetical protein [Candidatus Neomarinimicrobiota bacterium]MBT3824544.1 hypothetical protein [Candidatus Neomarinimicrobiota bacterium]MBT4130281.1 hypothetical protein [Candidatus Neomarinimicrobiota bacterium]MBT4297032.1 hypothetical protein [Candidatus Neomarinimicrobiota bacterium]
MATSIGAKGYKVTDRAHLQGILQELFTTDGPALVEIESDVALV